MKQYNKYILSIALLSAFSVVAVAPAQANIVTDIVFAPVKGAIGQVKGQIDMAKGAIKLGRRVLGARQHKVEFKVAKAQLRTLGGTWYDDKGRQKFRANKNSIDGHKMMAGFDFTAGYPGEGTFRTSLGKDKNKDIRVQWFGEGQHRAIAVNNQALMLQKPAERTHTASIGGLYLGMSEDQLLKVMGKPNKKQKDDWDAVWTYSDAGLTVYLTGHMVCGLSIDRTSSLTFDGTGLSATSSQADFFKAYSGQVLPPGQQGMWGNQVYRIADGEYLSLLNYPHQVGLFMSSQGENEWQ